MRNTIVCYKISVQNKPEICSSEEVGEECIYLCAALLSASDVGRIRTSSPIQNRQQRGAVGLERNVEQG